MILTASKLAFIQDNPKVFHFIVLIFLFLQQLNKLFLLEQRLSGVIMLFLLLICMFDIGFDSLFDTGLWLRLWRVAIGMPYLFFIVNECFWWTLPYLFLLFSFLFKFCLFDVKGKESFVFLIIVDICLHILYIS